ncbi:MAG: hypothetical protein MPK06_05110 [Alphaproteobacteria bacterium]|nr:hypothetical protein [Alphaproteobacteria bacterium]MDA7987885.1 hypothetical protein [Alphaproteobacteria bacterium]MDA8004687.1 hypothetical protein [Alphaproteobacteria bacterium]MDA8005900.1 hypothetical protein [Alphaproteobacteria bacterium]MDA8013901.1 hypothetical protein [Alphaproteobacteria bacterium]
MLLSFRNSRASTRRLGGRRGFTLLEAIGFLTVATIIVASTLGVYDQAQIALRTNQTIVAVGLMSTAVRTLHTNVGRYGTGRRVRTIRSQSYGEDLMPIIARSNSIPPGMQISVDSGGVFTVRSPFSGEIEIAVRATGAGQSFFIEIGDLAQDVCINIASQSVGGSYYGLESVTLNSTIFERARGVQERGPGTVGPTGSQVYPITPVQAEAACIPGGQNIMRWTYT